MAVSQGEGTQRRADGPGPSPGSRSAALATAKAAGALVAVIGLVVLVGWAFDIPALKSLHPSFVSMKANTATGFVLGGVALFLGTIVPGRTGIQRAEKVCALMVAVLGLMTLAEYVFGQPLGIDEVLFGDDSGALGTSHPGRMAPNTALAFLLLGVGLLGSKTKRAHKFSEGVLVVAALIGITTIVGYVNGVTSFYSIAASTRMALHTATAFVVVSIGALCANPDGGLIKILFTGGAGGQLARRILPGAILVPIVLGWLRLQGERAGLYGGDFGLSLMVVMTIVLLSAMTLLNLRSVEAADQKRRKVESRFRELIEAAPDAVVIVSQSGKIELINDQTERLFGYPRDELLGQPVEVLIPPRYRQHHASHRSSYFAAPKQRTMGRDLELFGARKDGSEFPAEISLRPLETDTGTLVTAAIRDVSDRRKAEIALRVHADVMTNMPIGLTVWRLVKREDPRTLTLTAFNPTAERAIGLPLAARIGETMAEIFPVAAASSLLEQYADIVRLGQARDFGEIPGEDATTRGRIYSVRGFPLPDQSLGFSFEDITTRKQSDDARALLAAIVESSQDAIIGKSLDGVIANWNRGAERMFLFTSDEATGRPTSLFVPESRRDEESRLVERLKQGEGIDLFETVRRRKDGTELDVSATLSPIKNGSGEVIGISTIVRDITETKRAARALIEAKELAEASNKELEAFSYSVSHDLRAPLRAIDGFSQALLEDHADKLDEEGKQHLGRIRAGAQKMGHLIDDMIRLSQVTRTELQRTKVDLSRIARELAEGLHRDDPSRSVDVVIQEGLAAEGDPKLLRVALDNLIGNAWKFTAKQAQARIEFGLSDPMDGRPVYFVRDNGAGFDMTYANKLFGAFQRLHSMNEFPGTGIGLATVQRVVHRHGGRVWAEGAVNEGAVFFFTL